MTHTLLTFLTWSTGRDQWQWCRLQTDAAPSQTDASGGSGRYSGSVKNGRRMRLDSTAWKTSAHFRYCFHNDKRININIWAPTSFSISVLLYSRWCRSITEELCSFASGDKLLQESTRARENKSNILSTSLSISHCTKTHKNLTLSGTDCWSPCGQYHGRIQQQPWRRPRDQSNTSSVYLSVAEQRGQPCVMANSRGGHRGYIFRWEIKRTSSRVNMVCPTLKPCLQLW